MIQDKTTSKNNSTEQMINLNSELYNLIFSSDQSDQGTNSINLSQFELNDSRQARINPIGKSWSEQDERLLLDLHKRFGNKWIIITRYYMGSSENLIKNHFYSRLRKSIRKLNNLVRKFQTKKYDKFKLNIIFKLTNISQGKISEHHKIDSALFAHYKELLYDLIITTEITQLQSNQFQQQQQNKIESLILSLVALENIFRLIRGKRAAKGKKKNIAYLRQFRFPLNYQKNKNVVITKQNIYLENTINCMETSTFKDNILIASTNPDIDHLQMRLAKEESFDENLLEYRGNKNSVILSPSCISLFDLEIEDNQINPLYLDYRGEELREYDYENGQSLADSDWKSMEDFSNQFQF